jgi:heat shock protein HslJ
MKKLIFFAFTISVLFTACGNLDDDASPSNSNSNNSTTPAGSWKVTWFWDKDKDETHKFSGYSFEFQSGGSLVATSGSNTYNGTWSKNSSGSKLTINITGSDALDEMTDDWLLDEMTNSSIKLRDDNDEHLEELFLEKQ